MKWAVELGQFDINYKPKTIIKLPGIDRLILEFPLDFEVSKNECIMAPAWQTNLNKIMLIGGTYR